MNQARLFNRKKYHGFQIFINSIDFCIIVNSLLYKIDYSNNSQSLN